MQVIKTQPSNLVRFCNNLHQVYPRSKDRKDRKTKGLHRIVNTKGPTQDSQHQRAYTGQSKPKGLHRIVKTKGPTQDSQNQRAYTGQSKPKGLHRIVKIKGPTQDSQNQRAYTAQSKSKGLHRIVKIKGPTQDSQNWLRSPMPEGGEPVLIWITLFRNHQLQ